MTLEGTLAWLVASLAVALAIAVVVGSIAAARQHRSLTRIAAGLTDLLAGNDARRIVVPDGGLAGRIADDVNELAERFCVERENRTRREEAHRQLLANISHDLRTPLTAIAGYADALARGLGDDPDRYLTVLSAKTAELSRLTDDLFYLTRMDAGDISLERIAFDVGGEVGAALLSYDTELQASGIEVEAHLPEAPCIASGDPGAVRRIAGNLISNALRHAEGMTRLEVSVTSVGASCRVEITDDGKGFSSPPERLFERGTTENGGTGLGLAIARGLALRMGGSITASSEPGVRTVFVFELPGGERRV